ncbi:flavin oxidoreductase/NADH oxidase [Anaerocolumna sp. AGMB13025]|uniref:oxidoreductase n=1 Tax=Anaerocolumna sp. AGMB13025 TaxID=3039116 RepID=UPI00241D1183|nr:flavin oxidoreductase/NADH oxidase [Anaerocolumna sp. AGMB13025]WFR56008.1 flavin oxidoreductase/NADH oxidase [Anaerocolumna sp. AGMB13025]
MDKKIVKLDSIERLKEELVKNNLYLPISEDIKVLRNPVNIGDKTIPNRIGIHPMEGCDGTKDGKPDELTIRRYDRFAKSGAGLLWLEATAVVNEGRANSRQLFINEDTKEDFKKLVTRIKQTAKDNYGEENIPYTVMQLTHSGRYSKPKDKPEPIIAAENEYLDPFLPKDYKTITDGELEALEDSYVKAAILAKETGIDAVDIKSCHRYLNSELLSAHLRSGKYGGSFENRTRFLIHIVDKIKSAVGEELDVTLRMNAYDAIPYPYGFGVDKQDFRKPDLYEPVRLIKMLRDRGIKLINISCGNPYYNPHIGRPYDLGPYNPLTTPLFNTVLMLNVVKTLQESVPEVAIVATGLSWLKDLSPYVAAGGIKEGWFKIAGFGRQAFAYPEFAKDILETGRLERSKCCICCSKCTEIMRTGGKAGCVIKDSEIYLPIYKQGITGEVNLNSDRIAEHI